MRYGSLFSGIGGFDEGFRRAGMEPAWLCEFDSNCRNVLRRHFEGVPIYEDVRSLNGATAPRCDVICGGFPCQDLSVAGRRAGLDGERSGLWFEFHRIVAEHQPQWVVIENVPGLLSSNGGADFAVILRGLVECGYGVCWRVLDAQHFGLAQRRKRVFVVASLGDGRAAQVLFESESGDGYFEQSEATRADIAPTISGGFKGAGGGNRPGMNTDSVEALIPAGVAVEAIRNGYTGGADDNDAQAGHIVVSRDAVPKTANGKVTDLRAGNPHPSCVMVAAPLVARQAKGGFTDPVNDNIIPVTWGWNGDTTPKYTENHSVTLRAQQGGEGTGDAGAFGVRRLMPVECERLQGFKDGWTDLPQSDSIRYRQLGNAVAVPCAEWIGRRIMEANS